MKMTHYQHGYKFEYDIAVFLIIQTVTGLFYAYIKDHPDKSGVRVALTKIGNYTRTMKTRCKRSGFVVF
jgi:hypothetical protein